MSQASCSECGRAARPSGIPYEMARVCWGCWRRRASRVSARAKPSDVRHCVVCDTRLPAGVGPKCGECQAECGVDRPASWDEPFPVSKGG